MRTLLFLMLCFRPFFSSSQNLSGWENDTDFNSGHLTKLFRDSSGRVDWFEEVVSDSFDAEIISYYPDGKKRVQGYWRLVSVTYVNRIDSNGIGEILDKKTEAENLTSVGEWHYYYPNGLDSAAGIYARITYEFDTLFPYKEGDLFICIGSTKSTENKTGTWKYYSREGKLEYFEEWDKGNLIKRQWFLREG